MSRISELITWVKIYNLCNHCDNYKCGECRADDVNCKEEIEKQIIAEIRADAIDEFINKVNIETEWRTESAAYKDFMRIAEQLKDGK